MNVEAVSESSTAIPIQPWMLEPAPPSVRRSGDNRGGPSDAALLARIARGDLGALDALDAFRAFYERHSARVEAFARRLCRDPQTAEDAAQEVFTTVWMRASRFDAARGDAAGWLYALTRNRVIDHWRQATKGQPEKGRPAETIDDRIVAAPPGGEKDLHLTLRQALSRVPAEQRQAIELAYFGGLTYQETAGELELPVGTLKSRIRLGLRAMRSFLEAN